jgi:hypothetical protein
MRVRDVMTKDVATIAPDTDLEAFVDRVPGVVAIKSRLHWEHVP